jgi:hypothetical protein
MSAAEYDEEWAGQLGMRLLSSRVYKYFTKHSNDASFASQPEESNPAARERRQRKIEELREILQEAFNLQELTNDMTPLHKLGKCWAQKKNGTYLALSDEVADKLALMFMARQGTKNKGASIQFQTSRQRATQRFANASLGPTTLLQHRKGQIFLQTEI